MDIVIICLLFLFGIFIIGAHIIFSKKTFVNTKVGDLLYANHHSLKYYTDAIPDECIDKVDSIDLTNYTITTEKGYIYTLKDYRQGIFHFLN